MDTEYHVPVSRSPYRWRMIIRMVIALLVECYYVLIIRYRFTLYQKNIALGDTFEHYIAIRPILWAFIPLSIALVCLLIGIGLDGWMLLKQRGSPAFLPIPYRLALFPLSIALVIYLANRLTIIGS
ncbi:hypothetical protein Hgul01_04082 [Herpetosiphon gulosus]|uniref:Uncharacterized protein n=1 Tax=Herpetosiphon gulosus TaxID=1973496 RepID=A0ABP9X4E7_9CHLR